MTVKLPITNQPNQSFTCTIPGADTNLTLSFFVYWNRVAEYWQMDITDTATQTSLVSSLPLIYSKGLYQNIMHQYTYMGIGQAFLIPIGNPTMTQGPGESGWDSDYILIWAL